MFKREGLGEFAKENKGKDFKGIAREKRRARVDKKGRIRERIEERARRRANLETEEQD